MPQDCEESRNIHKIYSVFSKKNVYLHKIFGCKITAFFELCKTWKYIQLF